MLTLTRRSFGKLAAAPLAFLVEQTRAGRPFSYVHLDVFTNRPFEGNQLLAFLDAGGLDVDTMQAITRESNYSECTFVFPPEGAGTNHRVRIFTRTAETPFAGHPTIGTAFALAHAGVIPAGTARTVFGLGVGPTPIDLEWDGSRLTFAWMTQLKPTFGKTIGDPAALAAALNIDPAALGRVPAQEVNCGSTFLIVPVATRRAVDGAALDRAKTDAVFAAAGIQRRGVYVVSIEAAADGAAVYSRLLAAAGGIEDPATGSAAGPAGSYIAQHGLLPADRVESMVFLQGVLVRRPSRIHVRIAMAGRDISGVKVGGNAVVVGEGSVRI
jgi:trans-2,3-dihydro-3-hydroxyanthranilate isomerase